jgi:hypothetical protein
MAIAVAVSKVPLFSQRVGHLVFGLRFSAILKSPVLARSGMRRLTRQDPTVLSCQSNLQRILCPGKELFQPRQLIASAGAILKESAS